MNKFALAIMAASMIAAPAFAQDTGTYVNFGAGQFDGDGIQNSVLFARVGQVLAPNFAVEAEGGFGIDSDVSRGVDVKTDTTLGAYAVARAPVTNSVTLLGRAGYQHSWATGTIGNVSVETNDGSFAIGVGAELAVSPNSGLRADYTRLTETHNDYTTISYVHRF